MLFYVVLGLIFVTGSLVGLFILLLLGKRYNPVNKRLRNVGSISGNFDLKEELLANKGSVRKKFDPKIEKVVSILVRFTKKNEQYNSKLRKSLMQAGLYRENSVRIFLSLKVFGAIIMFLTFAIFGYLGRGEVPSIFLMGFVMALMGYVFPNLVLRVKIRRRQEEIAGGLPDALDFLVICVEAGLSLNSALIRVGQELQLRSKAFGEELLMVNQEMRTSISREQAFRNLSERNQNKDLKILTGAIIISDRLGTNIADTLRVQSDSLRTRVRQRAEEQAAKAGLKMLFPLVFFIFPSLFIVILGPAIIMAIKYFQPVTTQ